MQTTRWTRSVGTRKPADVAYDRTAISRIPPNRGAVPGTVVMAFDYATCSRTYVMLRIYHDDMDLAVVQKTLGLRPTRAQKKGDRYKVMHVPRIATVGFWLLSSEGKSQSTDSRKHLQWLLKKLDGKAGAIAVLKQAGYRLDICCFWEKASGGFGGGPTLSPEIMRQLADLDLEFWFDIYSQWSDEPPDEEVH